MMWRNKISIKLPYLFFKKRDDPQHCTTPSAIMAIRSPSKSASSIKWVDNNMVRPCLWLLIKEQENSKIST